MLEAYPDPRSHGLLKILESLFPQSRLYSPDNVPHDGRPFEDQSRVDLDQRGSGGDLFPSVLRIEDTPDSNDGDCAFGLAVNVSNDFGAAGAQRPSTQPSGLRVNGLRVGI